VVDDFLVGVGVTLLPRVLPLLVRRFERCDELVIGGGRHWDDASRSRPPRRATGLPAPAERATSVRLAPRSTAREVRLGLRRGHWPGRFRRSHSSLRRPERAIASATTRLGRFSRALVLGCKHFADPAMHAEFWSCRLAPCCRARAAVPAARCAGHRHRDPVCERSPTQPGRVGPAGIIGAGRSWTAWMISVLSIPRK
jgi:hypothetical protein